MDVFRDGRYLLYAVSQLRASVCSRGASIWRNRLMLTIRTTYASPPSRIGRGDS
jgi:hypothetical protein